MSSMVQAPALAPTLPMQDEPPYDEVAPAEYSPETVAEVQAEQGMSDGAESALSDLLLEHLATGQIQPDDIKATVKTIFKPFIVTMIYNTSLRKSPNRKHLLDEDVQRQANTMVNKVVKHAVLAVNGKKADKIRQIRSETPVLAAGVEDVPRLSQSWADEAAATIVTSSLEDVKETLARSLGLTHKKWLTRMDSKVRHSHSILEGQTVPIEGSFQLPSGIKLSRPGDPEAPLSERINCRCRTLYLLPGKTQ